MCLLTSAPTARGDDPPVALRLAFKAGETLRYEFQQRNTIKVNANGQETSNRSELTIGLKWAVRSVDAEGKARVAQTIERVRVTISSGPQNYRFDSQDPPEKVDPASKPLSQVYRPSIGKEYLLTVDGRGRISEVTIPQEVTEALRGSPFEASADGGSVFSAAGLKNMFSQVIPALPEKPVAVAAEWTEPLELPSDPLTIRLKNVYRLSKTTPRPEIGVSIAMTVAPAPGAQVTAEVKSQKGEGSFALDANPGRLVESSLKQSVSLKLGFINASFDQNSTAETSFKRLP